LNRVEEATEELIDAILESEEYFAYEKALNEVNRWPELKERIDEFREENFNIQMLAEERQIVEAVENFEKKYEGFRADDRVNDFLRSELAFNRMMQDIYNRMMDGINYE